MPRRPLVEREELAHMLRDRRMTYDEIAEETGLTSSGVKQAARRYKLHDRTPKLDHKWAIPWTVREDHNASKVRLYLRHLSAIGQGGDVPVETAHTALRWADQLVAEKLDVDYDRNEPPNDQSIQGGFYVRPAEPSDWHLKKVTQRAKTILLRKQKVS